MLLLTAALAAPPPLPRTPVELDPVVGLRFGWPAGMACDTVETITRAGFGPDDGVVRIQRAVLVDDAPDGVMVRTERVLAEGAISAAATLDLLRPAIQVGDDGHAVRITGMEDQVRVVRARAAEAVVRIDPAQKPALGAALRRASDAARIQTRTIDEWERAIGVWSGLYLAESVSGSAVANGPAALFPVGPSVQWFFSFRFEARVACADEIGEPRCVTIAYDAAPWGTGRTQILGEAAATQLATPEGVTWSDVAVGVRGTLTLDPSTLVPVRRAEVTRLLGRATTPTGEERLDLTVTTDERWTCAVRPPAPILDPLPLPSAPPPLPGGPPPIDAPPMEAPPLP